jgi:hypothetical protein
VASHFSPDWIRCNHHSHVPSGFHCKFLPTKNLQHNRKNYVQCAVQLIA